MHSTVVFVNVVCSLLLGLKDIQAEDITKHTLIPTSGMTRADIYVVTAITNPVAILLLAPGCNGDGKYLISDPVWNEYAKSNRLALVGLSFASNTEDIHSGKGYYYASCGSGTVLLEAVDRIFGKKLPLLLYGFSGGAHFVSRFSEWKPDRVMGWCAYSAGWWDIPKVSKIKPPGIVVCGEDDERLGASLAYFKQGRAIGKPWLWIEVKDNGHSQSKKVDLFVRNYYSLLLKKGTSLLEKGICVDIDSLSLASNDLQNNYPCNTGWLPSKTLFEIWRDLSLTNHVLPQKEFIDERTPPKP